VAVRQPAGLVPGEADALTNGVYHHEVVAQALHFCEFNCHID
jgi:hypothetical protein